MALDNLGVYEGSRHAFSGQLGYLHGFGGLPKARYRRFAARRAIFFTRNSFQGHKRNSVSSFHFLQLEGSTIGVPWPVKRFFLEL